MSIEIEGLDSVMERLEALAESPKIENALE